MLNTPQFAAARAIVARLRAEGHQAYFAGGCVRDLLLGRQPKDYDVATSAAPNIVLDLFPRTFAVGAHFGVVIVADEMEDHYIQTEVATFRSDGAYSDGRHPDAVRYTLSPKEDVQRRDFTINGLLLDPEALSLNTENPGAPYLASETWDSANLPASTQLESECPNTSVEQRAAMRGKGFSPHITSTETEGALAPEALRPHILDYVNGLHDLDTGILRAIGDPTLRFEEDHLRMLRAVRFAARFHYEIDRATFAAIRALAPRIASVSRERIREELTRMLTEGHARRAFELLDTSGLLAQVLPEVAKLKGVEQPPQFHPEGDVWTHTLMLLEQIESNSPMTLAWGALLHDIGKPATYQPPIGPNDRIRFNGHVEVGVAIGAEICRRLRFSNEETTQILALIENHMRFGDVHRMKAATLKRFFRLDRFPEHLALHRMDCNASHGSLDNYHLARNQYEAIPEQEVRPTPLLTGRDLIALGYHPGPTFKTILHQIEEAQLEGTIHSSEEAKALLQQLFPPTTNH